MKLTTPKVDDRTIDQRPEQIRGLTTSLRSICVLCDNQDELEALQKAIREERRKGFAKARSTGLLFSDVELRQHADDW